MEDKDDREKEELEREEEEYEREEEYKREEGRKRMLAMAEAEEETKQELVKAALAKFNWFLHLTAWLSGCAFLLILGIIVPRALPFVMIPVGLWTIGIAYHAWWAFSSAEKKPPKPRLPGRARRASTVDRAEDEESDERRDEQPYDEDGQGGD
jgi:hypothetical protein